MQLFFVLSGFLISGILIDSAGKPSYYTKFYVRRALRILPAYLLVLAVLKLDDSVSWNFVLAALLFIANMAGLVGARSSDYGPLWSLAVEEQFYLIWPFVVRRLSLESLTKLIVGYCLFVFVLRLIVLTRFPNVDSYYKLWCNADLLMSGSLIAICLRRNILRCDNIDRWILALTGAALLLWPLNVFLDLQDATTMWHRGLRALSFYSQPTTDCALLLLAIRSSQGVKLKKPGFVTRLLAFFGYISYGLYLVHQLVFSTFDRWVRGTPLGAESNRPWGLISNTLICLIVSTMLAFLSRRYFEDLFLRRKDRLAP